MNRRKLAIGILIALAIGAAIYFDAARFFDIATLKSQQAALEAHRDAHPVQTALLFFCLYITVIGASIPGAAILTLAAGAIFGLVWGSVIVSFASSLGATIAFLLARYLFRDVVQARFGKRLTAINTGVEKEGAFYLFTLRLVPLFPFFLINLALALTPIRTKVFYFVSQIGMLPATLVFVYAGTQLAKIDSISGILSPEIIGAFTLLGFFPLLTKRFVAAIKKH